MNSYRFTSPLSKKSGFSLVESMVAITLGLFLTAGLLAIFVSSHRTTNQTLDSGDRQENAVFALQLLAKDLRQSYFFAQATGENKDLWDLNGATVSSTTDCLDEISSGSFPISSLFRPLWASSTPDTLTSLEMDCLNDGDTGTSLVPGSDYISLKRVRGYKQTGSYTSTSFYLDINTSSLTVYKGDAANIPASAWEYMHHVYYLDTENGVGQLRRLTLTTSGMVLEEVLVEGVENMQFMFALDALADSDRDGSVDSFVSTSNVTANDWDTRRVIGIKIYLLIRSLEETAGYTNANTYQLGDYLVSATNDGYKRELVSRVILFQNSVVTEDD